MIDAILTFISIVWVVGALSYIVLYLLDPPQELIEREGAFSAGVMVVLSSLIWPLFPVFGWLERDDYND